MVEITSTRNYGLFGRSDNNRKLSLEKHKKLRQSMEEYGFIAGYPVVCFSGPDGQLVVLDGQHRLAYAEALKLPVYYVVVDQDFDIARVNSTARVWTVPDYAQKFAAQGNPAYIEGLAFAKQHSMPLGVAFALLAGKASYGEVEDDFVNGTFVVRARELADKVASVYVPLVAMSSRMNTSTFVKACMAICLLPEFSTERLLHGAEKRHDKVKPYASRDQYLEMFELVYNYSRRRLVPLKFLAVQAMRGRSAVQPKCGPRADEAPIG